MEQALAAALLAATGVTALVGQRVDWGVRAQGKGLPAVTLTRIGGLRDRHLTGPSGLIQSRVQIDCWATTYKAAHDLRAAVEAVVSGYDSAPIKVAHIDSESSSFEENGPEKVHRIRLDLLVWHSA